MNKFFRETLAGLLVLSTAGSLLATLLARLLPTPPDSGKSLLDAVSRPIPAWTLFAYSVLLVLAFALWAVRTRNKDRETNAGEQSKLMAQIAAITGERDAFRQQFTELEERHDGFRQRLADTQSGTLSRADLMRFVAVVLSTSQGNSFNPTTHEYVSEHVARLAGEGVQHAAIGEALASMLDIGAVESDWRGLFLVPNWKERMVAANVPVAFPQSG